MILVTGKMRGSNFYEIIEFFKEKKFYNDIDKAICYLIDETEEFTSIEKSILKNPNPKINQIWVSNKFIIDLYDISFPIIAKKENKSTNEVAYDCGYHSMVKANISTYEIFIKYLITNIFGIKTAISVLPKYLQIISTTKILKVLSNTNRGFILQIIHRPEIIVNDYIQFLYKGKFEGLLSLYNMKNKEVNVRYNERTKTSVISATFEKNYQNPFKTIANLKKTVMNSYNILHPIITFSDSYTIDKKSELDYFIPVCLTSQESKVTEYIYEGCTNKEISTILNISMSTVKKHVYSIYQKVGCRSRTDLISYIRNYKP